MTRLLPLWPYVAVACSMAANGGMLGANQAKQAQIAVLQERLQTQHTSVVCLRGLQCVVAVIKTAPVQQHIAAQPMCEGGRM